MQLDKIPIDQREDLKERFFAGDLEKVHIALVGNGIKICSTCNPHKEITTWLNYLFEHVPNWIDGENLHE